MASDPPRAHLVAHAPTPLLQDMRDAIADGLREVDAVEVRVVPALRADADDLGACGLTVLFTPANLGYISGALKHAFDCSFRELEGESAGHPFLAVVRGASDVTGAVRAIESITTGLDWRAVQPPWTREGEVTDDDLAELHELGRAMGTALEMGAL